MVVRKVHILTAQLYGKYYSAWRGMELRKDACEVGLVTHNWSSTLPSLSATPQKRTYNYAMERNLLT